MKTNINLGEALTDLLASNNLTKLNSISLILRTEEQMLEDRPNVLTFTRSANGFSLTQSPLYFHVYVLEGFPGFYRHAYDVEGDILDGSHRGGSFYRVPYRNYNDSELMQILENAKVKGLSRIGRVGSAYLVNA